jgi:hypothetical protein
MFQIGSAGNAACTQRIALVGPARLRSKAAGFRITAPSFFTWPCSMLEDAAPAFSELLIISEGR